jgi:hypothetical protein
MIYNIYSFLWFRVLYFEPSYLLFILPIMVYIARAISKSIEGFFERYQTCNSPIHKMWYFHSFFHYYMQVFLELFIFIFFFFFSFIFFQFFFLLLFWWLNIESLVFLFIYKFLFLFSDNSWSCLKKTLLTFFIWSILELSRIKFSSIFQALKLFFCLSIIV